MPKYRLIQYENNYIIQSPLFGTGLWSYEKSVPKRIFRKLFSCLLGQVSSDEDFAKEYYLNFLKNKTNRDTKVIMIGLEETPNEK